VDQVILDFVAQLIAQYPTAASILAIIGALRVINKPLFAFLNAVVNVTQFSWDNELLRKIEGSGAYKAFLFVMDWLGSVKIKK
jgi:hypothetical protein